MNLPQLLEKLKADPYFMENVTAWRTVPPRAARFAPWPEGIDPRLPGALAKPRDGTFSAQISSAPQGVFDMALHVISRLSAR